jgi:hypothetical protein
MKKMIAQARDKETAKEKATITKRCVFTTQTIAAQPLRCLIPASVRGFFYLLQKNQPPFFTLPPHGFTAFQVKSGNKFNAYRFHSPTLHIRQEYA